MLSVVAIAVSLSACSGPTTASGPVLATFTAVHGASRQQLSTDGQQLVRRLNVYGAVHELVTIRGRSIVVIGPQPLPVAVSTLIAPGVLQLRPALCSALPHRPSSGGGGPLPDQCSASPYSLQAPHLLVNTNTGTSNIASIAPDPTLTSQPTTSAVANDADSGDPVLLPLDGASGFRYLLGPSKLSGSIVRSASAFFQNPQWIVNVTLTGSGAVRFDELNKQYFHQIIGVDLDGRLVSAPLIEPVSSSFNSFAGRMQISGDLTKRSATAVAAELDSGPLAAPLRVSR